MRDLFLREVLFDDVEGVEVALTERLPIGSATITHLHPEENCRRIDAKAVK